MALLLSITRRVALRTMREIRVKSPLNINMKREGIRAMSTNRVEPNIVTSHVPDVPLPTGNIMNTLFENVNQWGTKTAVECSVTGRSYTYNQVLDTISKWAGFLTKLGLKKGDIIAVYMPNCPEYPAVVLGAASVGVIASVINSSYTADEVARLLNGSKAQLLVADTNLEATVLESLKKYNPDIPLIMNGPTTVPGALNWHDIMENPNIPYADPVDLTGHEIATMPYSSGTTGLPKGVSLSHNAYSSNIRMFCHPAFFPSKFATDDFQESYICLPPFYHLYGMLVFTMMGFYSGAKLVTIPQFEPNHYISTLRKHKVSTLHLVPPMLNFLVNAASATPDILPHLNSIIIGAAPVSPTVADAFVNKFKRDVFFQEGFGMTEIMLANIVPAGVHKLGTCGKVLPNVSAKIIDTATGEALPSTATGEICMKSPSMMTGYFQNESATSAIIDSEGWLHSGDVGHFDEEGFLTIVDRTKELIKVKGLQVSPSELEDIIRQHPKVLDVGVTAVPHDRNGEAPRAYIIAKEETSADSILSFVDTRVAPHKRLVGGIVFVTDLPKTATGKLLRKELKNMALQ